MKQIVKVVHDTSGQFSVGDITDKPCNTLTQKTAHWAVYEQEVPDGIGGGSLSNGLVQTTMAEIAAVPRNGYKIVSTFSGCGGSCLGFRWAGFETVWANEFIPAAAETYRANHPGVHLDTRDIRQVTAEEILTEIGMVAGDLDVLEGSPPCASFSMAGKREASWGKVKTYSDTKQRTDDLFFEYARLLDGLQPKVFVAENVKGLVLGKARGYFKEIHAALSGAGYNVSCRVLDAQFFGVPQHRERSIFIGVRKDLGIAPSHPKPQTRPIPLREALPNIIRQQHPARASGFGEGTWEDAGLRPSPTLGASPTTGNGRSSPAFVEVEGDISRYAIGKEWDKLKPGEKSKRYLNLVKASPERPSPCISASGGPCPSGACAVHPFEKRKFTIEELRIICGFPPDFILTGTYGQQWERLGRAVPPPMMKAIAEHVRDHILAQAQ